MRFYLARSRHRAPAARAGTQAQAPTPSALGRGVRVLGRGLGWATLLALVAVAASGLARLALRVGPLQIHGIEVRGLERTNREALLARAGLQLRQPLLGISLPAAVTAIEALPWVHKATVRRQLPDRLRIEVEEHVGKAAAMIGELWLINPAGEPFKRFSSADKLVLPVITGIRSESSERPLAAQPTVIASLQRGLDLLDAMLEVRDDLFNVDELHYDADLGWSSVLLLGRAHARAGAPRPTTVAHLGEQPKERLGALTYVLAQLAERHQVPEVIWAAHDHQEDRIQVQLALADALWAGPLPPPLRARSSAARPGRSGPAASKRMAPRPRLQAAPTALPRPSP